MPLTQEHLGALRLYYEIIAGISHEYKVFRIPLLFEIIGKIENQLHYMLDVYWGEDS